ncbi:MBL fold metallo-hydrolase [Marinobacter bryozoorum]|jgi:glyoxylase-like metal-dependent hydrolase (beta-lactamase superfamily II)|uniref:MBL fold metallo-hydrolase n=1 Tax=Marinobacter bryozoorum TaxID=256324 RepID=UPI0020058EC3|nr:MBL fold metallo-hydrolase [Marinobacter bryozoorum]MCK7545002.1 MBL fold metallo-hydrolase [Marinobacter bryozoorum]
MSAESPTIIPFDHGIYAIDTEFAGTQMMDASHLIVDNGEAAFVDVGSNFSIPVLLAALDKLGLTRNQVRYVCVTHVHLDHAGGAGQIMQDLPAATLVVHPRGARHMIDPSALYEGARQVYGTETMKQHYGDLIPVPAERTLEVHDGDTLPLGKRTLSFLDTPGHALHHYCIHDSKAGAVFSGDTFGISYRSLDTDKGPFIFPAATPVQFDPEKAHESVNRLCALNPRAIYLTHFSEITAIDDLAAQLHGDLDAYAAIGRRHMAEKPDTRGIRSDLKALFVRRLAAHGCDFDDDTLEQALGMDITLNTQGIAVWSAKQFKASPTTKV